MQSHRPFTVRLPRAPHDHDNVRPCTTFGTNHVPETVIERAVGEVFDLRPGAIIADLDLLRPIYSQLVAGGHFGRELPGVTWELTDRAEALAATARL